MSAVTWALFIPACFAINMAPGPNNMLAFSNAARFGFSHAMLGAFGRLVAFALMITLVAVGLGALLAASETAFTVVKWLGAAYLVYVGVKLLRSRFEKSEEQVSGIVSVRELARHEFSLAAGNPKAIATFTTFSRSFSILPLRLRPNSWRWAAHFWRWRSSRWRSLLLAEDWLAASCRPAACSAGSTRVSARFWSARESRWLSVAVEAPRQSGSADSFLISGRCVSAAG